MSVPEPGSPVESKRLSRTMVEHHSYTYDWRARFPDARRVLSVEGGGVYAAEADGAYWLITDEGTLADFLDPEEDADLLARAVSIRRYDERGDWEAAVRRSHWMRHIRDDELTADLLPEPQTPWTEDLILFARAFDGYGAKGGGEGLHAFVTAAREGFLRDGTLPKGLRDLRAALFVEERRHSLDGGEAAYPDHVRFVQALLDGIRREVAGSRAADESPFDPSISGIKDRLEATLQGVPDAQLFVLWASTMREMRRRGLIWTDKSPLGDFAEWLVAKKFGVQPEQNSANPGHDLTTKDGRRVQVKARKYTPRGHTSHFGDIAYLDEHRFDDFVGVLFEEDFTLRGAWVTSWERVVALAKPVHGKHRLSIAALRNDPESYELDLTDVWERLAGGPDPRQTW